MRSMDEQKQGEEGRASKPLNVVKNIYERTRKITMVTREVHLASSQNLAVLDRSEQQSPNSKRVSPKISKKEKNKRVT